MIDPIYLREKANELEGLLKKRFIDPALGSELKELSEKRRQGIQDVESLKAKRNSASKEIGILKGKAKKDPEAGELAAQKLEEMKDFGFRVKTAEEQLAGVEEKLESITMGLPNFPDESVPVGADESANEEIRKWGEVPKLDFKPKDHVDLGESLGILDFERAVRMSSSRFSCLIGAGAALERALAQFMLELHIKEHGYTELLPPLLLNREALKGTSQLPKFEDDQFKTHVNERDLFLLPTAEVSLTNFHHGEILEKGDLPKYYTGFTPCFRKEAGSHGKDTRGLIRLHQFQKVELVKIVEPEKSFEELESLVQSAEKVLQLLELPYRLMLLSSGDMSFASAKTYDLEVWLPGQDQYREISSCSNCTDFQARRMKTRFRREPKGKPELVHTLNGSGLAVGRTWLAVIENGQTAEGEVRIPKVLNRYLDGLPGFEKRGDELFITKPKA